MVQRTDLPRDTRPKELFKDEADKNRLEIRNGLLQFDEVIRLVDLVIASGTFQLTPETIRSLHSFAIRDIYSCAGTYRNAPITISNTVHQPPEHTDAPRYAEELCAYVNGNWHRNAIHLSSYVMWRLNWIHPFAGGNGRTSRAASYLVLCARVNQRLNGTLTIPDQIESDSQPYYSALDAADLAWSNGVIDVSVMESLLHTLLARQLLSANETSGLDSELASTYDSAGSSEHPPPRPPSAPPPSAP